MPYRTLALALPCLLACAAPTEMTDDDERLGPLGKADDASVTSSAYGFPNEAELMQAPALEFCPDIRLPTDPELGNPHTVINRTNAHYLAYMSGNAYADFVHFAPPLEELGFGEVGEGARLYACGVGLARMRAWESRREQCGSRGCRPNPNFDALVDEEILESWGECAADWYRATYGAGSEAPRELHTRFEQELTGTAHRDAGLEFFTGGEFDVGDERFEPGTTQLIWARHREQPLVIVAFRGTEFQRGLEDLWTDLNALRDPFYDWGEVHRGFVNALDTVDALLDAKLAELEGTDTRVWVTGHSLGAALATLFTARLMYRIDQGLSDINLVGSYTFGSPRTGDEDFRVRMEELALQRGVSLWRFRNRRDAVARVPDGWRFDHVGGLAHFDGDTLVLESMLRSSVPRGFSDLWEDHSMVGYYDHVLSWNDLGARSPRIQSFGVDAIYDCVPPG